jgi:hypothetical protein
LGDIFNNGQTGPGSDTSVKKSQFKKLTTYPVAGVVAYDLTTSKTLPVPAETPGAKPVVETTTKKIVRYVSRRNGYVYEIDNGSVPLQITNISIPNIYEAVFTNSNNNVLLRFLRSDDRTIATYNVPIPKENPDGTRTQINGSFLPDNISSLVASPDGNKIVYLMPGVGGSDVMTADFSNLKSSKLLDSTFREWLVSWPTDKKVFLQTKSSGEVGGFLYYVDTTEKKMRRVLSGVLGLTTSVSPAGNYVIYSQRTEGGFVSRIFNTKTNSDKSLGLAVLPEKCGWFKNENLICAGSTSVEGLFPDDWYQGVVSFSDKIYLINTQDMSVKILYDGTNGIFDMTNLQIDEMSRLLYFVDKNTGELWRFNY